MPQKSKHLYFISQVIYRVIVKQAAIFSALVLRMKKAKTSYKHGP
jgi:hypothetical protein